MKATSAFLGAIGPIDILDYRPRELIHLKDGGGRLVDYVDTALTRRMRREVFAFNEAFRSIYIALASHDVHWQQIAVHIDSDIVHPPRVACHRVFNGAWDLGGRLYGPFWQNLNKDRRLQLTMDGVCVVEHDFAQLHPRLLYAEFGRRLEGDAYVVRGYEGNRPRVKHAWQILINAASRRVAIPALAKKLGGLQHQTQAAQLLDALENHHRPVAPAFYTGAGLRLQRRDSDLLIGILRECQSEGIVALPVHDSLVVQRGRNAERAREIMEIHLDRLLGQLLDSKK